MPGQPAHFYGMVGHFPEPTKVVIGNLGLADATYEVYRYTPDNPIQLGMIPSYLNGNSGWWDNVGGGTVPAGFAATPAAHHAPYAPASSIAGGPGVGSV